ncbi:hypothetical protein HD806DRAFT_529853 [Xylariaceae sp. AK1471]|nr:hypothetical protein HD806DRAFT_529853 [Xylariaceae sp. AK1471]
MAHSSDNTDYNVGKNEESPAVSENDIRLFYRFTARLQRGTTFNLQVYIRKWLNFLANPSEIKSANTALECWDVYPRSRDTRYMTLYLFLNNIISILAVLQKCGNQNLSRSRNTSQSRDSLICAGT